MAEKSESSLTGLLVLGANYFTSIPGNVREWVGDTPRVQEMDYDELLDTREEAVSQGLDYLKGATLGVTKVTALTACTFVTGYAIGETASPLWGYATSAFVGLGAGMVMGAQTVRQLATDISDLCVSARDGIACWREMRLYD